MAPKACSANPAALSRVARCVAPWAVGVASIACGSTTSAPPQGTAGAPGGHAAGGASAAGAAGGRAGDGGGARAVPSPIPAPAGDQPGDGALSNVQAIKKLVFPANPADAFKQAYPVDGLKFTDPNDPAHCKLRPGGKPKDVVVDGPNGEDNSFGKNIWPIVLGLAPDSGEVIDGAIAAGEQTSLLRIEKLGVGKNYYPLFAELFSVTGKRDGMGSLVPPTDWASYEWQAYSDGLAAGVGSGDDLHSLVQFPASYVVDDLWVGGAKRDVTVWLGMGRLRLTIHLATVTVRLSADRQAGYGGILSGVLDTDEFIHAVRAASYNDHLKVPAPLCDDGMTVLMQLVGASDMMKDGTQNGAATCDGISIAIGFETEAAKLGQPVAPPPPSPCE